MKAVMLSLRPQWCEKIFNGEKTIEVRKSRPSLDMPVKVYVYETKAQFVKSVRGACTTYGYGRGKVIGSFVCDRITCCQAYYGESGEKHLTNLFGCDVKNTCLTEHEMFDYIIGKDKKEGTGWLWHITEPKLFDKPKELSEFGTVCNRYENDECDDCPYLQVYVNSYPCDDCVDTWCGVDNIKPLTRPPQSWQYVEELQ